MMTAQRKKSATTSKTASRQATTAQSRQLEPVEGFLIDIDGVLIMENQLINGAVDAIKFLQNRRIPFMLATNTTRKSRFALSVNLKQLGFAIEPEQIYSAPLAAASWLREKNVETISLLASGDIYREFKDFRITNARPEYLVIGDIGENLTYNLLNQAFRQVMGGAKMLAMQKNRFWRRSDGLSIDSGAIVAALEYATGQSAELVGKPSSNFFHEALVLLGLQPEKVAMVGDDWESDIVGSIKAGLQAIAVKTGKMNDFKIPRRSKISPVWIDSIADLPKLIKSMSKK
jgi:HAD superfamily hydrolase (TIGR01458 family)